MAGASGVPDLGRGRGPSFWRRGSAQRIPVVQAGCRSQPRGMLLYPQHHRGRELDAEAQGFLPPLEQRAAVGLSRQASIPPRGLR